MSSGSPALGQGSALHASPALIGRRVGQVDHQRQDLPAVGAGLLRLVEMLDRHPIAIHRHDMIGMLGDDPREGAGVAAEIPGAPPAALPGCLAHERAFGRELGGDRSCGSGRSRPRWSWSRRGEAAHDLTQPRHVAHDELPVEAGLGDRVADPARPAGIAALQRVLRHHMQEHARPDEVSRGDQPTQGRGRDAVDLAAQPGAKVDALIGLQEQGVEEQLAELPVADPRLAVGRRLERWNIDEDRLGPPPLDIVGGGVLEDEPGWGAQPA